MSKVQRIALLLVLTVIVAVSLVTLSMRTIVPGMPDRVAFTPAPGQPRSILVDVEGCVANPGLYHVPEGSRVYEVLQLAGGVSAEADTDNLDMAAIVRDGGQVYVPTRARPPAYQPPAGVDTSQVGPAVITGRRQRRSQAHRPRTSRRQPQTQGLEPTTRIDVNLASAKELTRLPGIGPTIAARIVEFRQARGEFRTMDDLEQVKGIGPAKAQRIEPYVSF